MILSDVAESSQVTDKDCLDTDSSADVDIPSMNSKVNELTSDEDSKAEVNTAVADSQPEEDVSNADVKENEVIPLDCYLDNLNVWVGVDCWHEYASKLDFSKQIARACYKYAGASVKQIVSSVCSYVRCLNHKNKLCNLILTDA